MSFYDDDIDSLRSAILAGTEPIAFYNVNGVCSGCKSRVHPQAQRCVHCTSLLDFPPAPRVAGPGFFATLKGYLTEIRDEFIGGLTDEVPAKTGSCRK